MSDAITSSSASGSEVLLSLSPTPSRGFAARIVGDALSRWGARLGLAWIALLVFAAVFAPLIANSHPILLKQQGVVSSPLLRHLTSTDVFLLLMTAVLGVLLVLRKISWPRRVLMFAGIAIIVWPVCLLTIKPPQTVVYDRYREAAVNGQVEWALYTPIRFSPSDRLRDQPEARLGAPNSAHLMGTDIDGSDVASRMIYACRIALSIGFISTGIATLIGVIVGGVLGYFSGWVDMIGLRIVEIFSAIPTLFLLLAFVAFFGRNLYLMMVIIGLTSWVGDAIFVRAEFLRLRQQDFVQAARACGLPLWSILFRHMLPNGITPVLINVSFGVAGAILAESTLSFLGLGLVDEPSWGALLSQALGAGGTFYWWIAVFPGSAIFLTVFAYNLIGEALRDAIDPRAERSAAAA
jgi:peptide/nickel transport system permease protein